MVYAGRGGSCRRVKNNLRTFKFWTSQKNDLDRGRRYGREVSDSGIPHGFHTNDRVKLHHPAQPRKTRDAKNAMKSRNEAKCAGGEPYPPSGLPMVLGAPFVDSAGIGASLDSVGDAWL